MTKPLLFLILAPFIGAAIGVLAAEMMNRRDQKRDRRVRREMLGFTVSPGANEWIHKHVDKGCKKISSHQHEEGGVYALKCSCGAETLKV